MSIPIPPLTENDLPDRKKSFWRMTGPGAIMIGIAIGSGEMILWPWVVAKFGSGMIWAAALGVFLQLWINFEIGRWAVATGESTFTGFARLSKFTVYFFIVLLAILALLPAWARATGIAMRTMFFGPDGPGADWMIEQRPESVEGVGLLLNEGGSGSVQDGKRQFGVEVTQKVPFWIRLTATGEPGHGSRPNAESAVTRL